MNHKKKLVSTGVALALCAGTVTLSYSQQSAAQSVVLRTGARPMTRLEETTAGQKKSELSRATEVVERAPDLSEVSVEPPQADPLGPVCTSCPGGTNAWPAAVAAAAAVVVAATEVAHRVHESWMPGVGDEVITPEVELDLAARGQYDARR